MRFPLPIFFSDAQGIIDPLGHLLGVIMSVLDVRTFKI